MPNIISHHEIYDAALDDELFTLLPDMLAREIDIPSAVFIWLHPGDYREITAGTQAEANLDYNSFEGHDPWLAHGTPEKCGKGLFRLSDHVGPQEFERSEMYNDFILKNRIDRYWCLGMMQSTRDGLVATAFHKGKRGGDFTDPELQTLDAHVEDLGRLHKIRRELHRASIRQVTATDHSLLNDAPIFELDHEGRLVRMNGMAEILVELHPLLVLDFERKLRSRGAIHQGLRQAIGRSTDAEKSEAGSLDLPQMRATDGRIVPRLRLNLLPRTDGGRKVLVIVTSEEEDGLRNLAEAPREKMRLTPRERNVLHGLVRGRRRDQLAHDLDIAIPTIDLHSANLRRKLGARTIVEAVAIALKFGLM
ncbi:regulatory LuxR family protein [Thioclava sp. ES.031]|uniref:LuxR C-terminal-related transcriptional regulator n=1 Tax=Thioclava sp. ES.031 TaxID=1798203 RepID=UPI000BF8B43E|nr:LuxR C-terminal-related transcriptional regulator [Thioclava sp. ES.031]PFG62228.1 regulatory LuxR family protein [Thioclava sp. ES.031]